MHVDVEADHECHICAYVYVCMYLCLLFRFGVGPLPKSPEIMPPPTLTPPDPEPPKNDCAAAAAATMAELPRV